MSNEKTKEEGSKEGNKEESNKRRPVVFAWKADEERPDALEHQTPYAPKLKPRLSFWRILFG